MWIIFIYNLKKSLHLLSAQQSSHLWLISRLDPIISFNISSEITAWTRQHFLPRMSCFSAISECNHDYCKSYTLHDFRTWLNPSPNYIQLCLQVRFARMHANTRSIAYFQTPERFVIMHPLTTSPPSPHARHTCSSSATAWHLRKQQTDNGNLSHPSSDRKEGWGGGGV